ncbi:MAG: hypothetical protein Q8926_10680 [Bacteroidota bacterium]|nr:hypothetical protein [Bacteroidota bacterium]
MKKNLFVLLLVITGLESKTQTIASLKKDMYGIASDATGGRFTASAGYLKAARYIEMQLRAAGIKPGWREGNKKTFLQQVPFT